MSDTAPTAAPASPAPAPAPVAVTSAPTAATEAPAAQSDATVAGQPVRRSRGSNRGAKFAELAAAAQGSAATSPDAAPADQAPAPAPQPVTTIPDATGQEATASDAAAVPVATTADEPAPKRLEAPKTKQQKALDRFRASKDARDERTRLAAERTALEQTRADVEKARAEAQQLFEAGDYDAALQRMFGVTTTDLQKRILQKKGAIAQEPPEFQEMRRRLEVMEQREREREAAQQKQRQTAEQQRQDAEFTRQLQAELASSEYADIAAYSAVPGFVADVKRRIMSNPDPDADMDAILWQSKQAFDALANKMLRAYRPDLAALLDAPAGTVQTPPVTPLQPQAPAPAVGGATQALPAVQAQNGRGAPALPPAQATNGQPKPATLPQRAAAEPTAEPQIRNRHERRTLHFRGVQGLYGR